MQAVKYYVRGGNDDDDGRDNGDEDEEDDEDWTKNNAQGVRFIVKAPSVYHHQQHRAELRQINFTV